MFVVCDSTHNIMMESRFGNASPSINGRTNDDNVSKDDTKSCDLTTVQPSYAPVALKEELTNPETKNLEVVDQQKETKNDD